MKMPSVKVLHDTFRDLSEPSAHIVRAIGHVVDDADALNYLLYTHIPEDVRRGRFIETNHHMSRMWRVTMALRAIDYMCVTHGVEALGDRFEYLNAGDPYINTLVYDKCEDSLDVCDWASIAENLDASEEG